MRTRPREPLRRSVSYNRSLPPKVAVLPEKLCREDKQNRQNKQYFRAKRVINFLGSAMVPKSQMWQTFPTIPLWKAELFTLN